MATMSRILIAALLLLQLAACAGASFGGGLSPNCRVVTNETDDDSSNRSLRCG